MGQEWHDLEHDTEPVAHDGLALWSFTRTDLCLVLWTVSGENGQVVAIHRRTKGFCGLGHPCHHVQTSTFDSQGRTVSWPHAIPKREAKTTSSLIPLEIHSQELAKPYVSSVPPSHGSTIPKKLCHDRQPRIRRVSDGTISRYQRCMLSAKMAVSCA